MGLYVKEIKGSTRSPYVPTLAAVDRVTRVSGKERLFRLTPADAAMLDYRPGQFFMAGLPGYGEAPISVASPPGAKSLELCIRAVGNLTDAFHRLSKGGFMTLRGPFGTSFPVGEMKGRDILFVAGGIGIIPMRSLVKTIIKRPGDFGRLTLIYGAKSPQEMLFTEEFASWRARGLDVRLTVDTPHPGWRGRTGVVTELLPEVEVEPSRTTAVVIGPPVLYKFVVIGLRKRGIADSGVFLSVERRMKCGVGKCGHCQINSVYVCQEGPVFRLSDLKGLPEAL
ncbi:MAG: FAD/NAD(P)-binding protein [Thermodesulfobacteriota bacterium]